MADRSNVKSQLLKSAMDLPECQKDTESPGDQVAYSENVDDFFVRPSAHLSDICSFINKKGLSVAAYPVIVDFRRLLQLSNSEKEDIGIIPGVSNCDLLHAVVGLYDVSLSEMTPDVLYESVCDKWARTIILVRDIKESLNDLEEKRKTRQKNCDSNANESNCDISNNSEGSAETNKKSCDTLPKDITTKYDHKTQDCDTSISPNVDVPESQNEANEDVFTAEESKPSIFSDVYSDAESSEEEEDDSDDEDFSKGIHSFLRNVSDRKAMRETYEKPLQYKHLGIENRIIGCATFEKKYVQHKDRVIHLTLVSVRPTFRKFGIGKFLLSQVVDSAVVGHYDAVVVHADNSAVEFFEHFGFSDDVILNSRWSELAEQFTNCTLMCYLPGFTGHILLSTINVPGLEVIEMEQEFNKWKLKSIEAYQNQVSCLMRMKHEILQLIGQNTAQKASIASLVEENHKLRHDKFVFEKDILDQRLSSIKSTIHHVAAKESEDGDEEVEIDTEKLIQDLKRQVDEMDLSTESDHQTQKQIADEIAKCLTSPEGHYAFFPNTMSYMDEEPYDHMQELSTFYKVTERFRQDIQRDISIKEKYDVTMLNKATPASYKKEEYHARVSMLQDPTMVTDLYYCGSLEMPQHLQEILKNGFSIDDFCHGEFGRGLYFSKYPSKAAHFSARGQLLLVEVAIGRTETVLKTDRTRCSPDRGYDSIITPGRLTLSAGDVDKTCLQEYVLFDVNQVSPSYLISYSHQGNNKVE